MKKIILCITLLILISGCVNQENIEQSTTSFCKDPYIEYQEGACCMDKNTNGICDDDDLITKELETKETIPEETPTVEETIPEETTTEIEGETCPFQCAEEHECKPVYNSEGKLNRWTCVYIKN